ncbi:MAG: excinuclease ABC subunit UvrA [Acidobacteriota bacterium]
MTSAGSPGSRHASIRISGARAHNLKNISIELPAQSLVVVTGVSGSGKSSLVFDTLYAEGQRRYVETLSAYARQFLERMDKPDVDAITNISPTIAIQQKAPSRNPRSTVATVTEIHDYLRLLYSRIGTVLCSQCGQAVKSDSIDTITDRLRREAQGEVVAITYSRDVSDGSSFEQVREELLKRGFRKVWTEAGATPIEALPAGTSSLRVLVDRVEADLGDRERMVDSIEMALREGGGHMEAITGSGTLRFSERFECARCGIEYVRPDVQLFSFNSPHGACPRCHGFGNIIEIDPDLVIPDKQRSIVNDAIDPFRLPSFSEYFEEFLSMAKSRGIPIDVPYEELPDQARRLLWDGDGEFPGVMGIFEWLETKKYKVHVRVLLSRYRSYRTCHACKGQRLKPEALRVQVGGRSIGELCAMTVQECLAFAGALSLASEEAAVAGKVVDEIVKRLRYLSDVGLDYLTLDRLTFTLSGGEAQRIHLASSVGAALSGVLYILDEPSIGLHSRDTRRLIRILRRLVDLGNTVIVVEHDPEMIAAADHIVDLGPGAGERGGHLVYSGTLDGLLESRESSTGGYLSRRIRIPLADRHREPDGFLRFRGVRKNNLKSISLDIPLRLVTVITGVSGSGKSTLLYDCIYEAVRSHVTGRPPRELTWEKVDGLASLFDVVLVDQAAIGKSPRANPATYLGFFDEIRALLASTQAARRMGLAPSFFSFNVGGGRCPTCEGSGYIRVEMQFLSDVYLTCENCEGRRYKPQALDIRYRSKDVSEILNLTVNEAMLFFSDNAQIRNKMAFLDKVGLGYLRLGQPLNTLSGGEAQRIKLAYHLSKGSQTETLFLFDEPTTGLHFEDIGKLVASFEHLLRQRHTIVVIEHNLEIIKQADWIIDLGPEGGEAGGKVLFLGRLEQMLRMHSSGRLAQSHTARFLKRTLCRAT